MPLSQLPEKVRIGYGLRMKIFSLSSGALKRLSFLHSAKGSEDLL
jgi:hypothetical protein